MRHIVVIGLMSSGKTTIGAAIAAALGWPHRDSDADLLAATGMTARAIAAAHGIAHLHALELQHLLDGLADPAPSVISAAASVVDVPEGRAALADPEVVVVWLRTSPTTIERRLIGGDGHRPRPESIADQAARRDPRFGAVASVRVATDTPDGADRPVDDVVAEVLRGIGATPAA